MLWVHKVTENPHPHPCHNCCEGPCQNPETLVRVTDTNALSDLAENWQERSWQVHVNKPMSVWEDRGQLGRDSHCSDPACLLPCAHVARAQDISRQARNSGLLHEIFQSLNIDWTFKNTAQPNKTKCLWTKVHRAASFLALPKLYSQLHGQLTLFLASCWY